MGELQHIFGNRKLIVTEAEAVVGKDVECAMCKQAINKLIDAFYRCRTSATPGSSSSNPVTFFMHKTCLELPKTFTHPMNPERPLTLYQYEYVKDVFSKCDACKGFSQAFMYEAEPSDGCPEFSVCLKCVRSELKSLEPRTLCHRGHNHPLTLVQRPALFLCDACNTTATDLSYICTKCCFCIHKSCANAPITYQCKFHEEHPLILKYSLPDEYCEYDFYCSICNNIINPIYWVYYCANCRFFAHMKCASSTGMLSENDNDKADSGESNLMHLPAHDEASLYKMMQKCIMTQATDAHSATTVEPSPYIRHWSHEHQLVLGNNNSKTSTPYLNQNLEDSELLICDGCTKPISLLDDIFYECSLCKFFLHRSCAQFPRMIKHHLAGTLVGRICKKLANFKCQGCHIISNGITLMNKTTKFDIVCASLPTKIKHEGHRHPLNQLKYYDDNFCKACMLESVNKEAVIYGCERCGFYVHIWCALRPHLVKHRWDPHPLYLILFVKNVADHPHQFDCEFCSEEIDPNTWFYHCNACDLSFHIQCIDPFLSYSNIKFGATNIHSDSHPHQHGLTTVLNKKKRSCQKCWKDAFDSAVLECSQCKYIVHWYCPRS